MNDTTVDVFGMSIHQYADVNVYGLRGIGPSINAAYKALRDHFKDQYKCIRVDWPWDYIAFRTEEADQRFQNHPAVKPFASRADVTTCNRPFQLSDWQ